MKTAKHILSLCLSAVVLASPLAAYSSASDGEFTTSAMNTAKNTALSYESSSKSLMAFAEVQKYSTIANYLAETGECSLYEADIAEGWASSLEFSPQLVVESPEKNGIFFGSDGAYADGASAVKFTVPFGTGDTEDYFYLIPTTTDELFVLAEYEVLTERVMRDISGGKYDKYLEENLRQLSRIEGRVHLSFCPSVNTMRKTNTLKDSYVNSFRYVSALARRYAPNVSIVYSLDDVRIPSEDTVMRFYPGDEYVDVLGISLCHTYNKSEDPSPEAAFDNRGEYYDPVLSVSEMYDSFTEGSGREDIPLVITGASFPWSGYAARDSFAADMERFYRLIPSVTDNLQAVICSNRSSANGICNLRQNPEAFELYKQCLDLPWYVNGEDYGSGATLLEDLTQIVPDTPLHTEMYYGGKYAGNSTKYSIRVNGSDVSADKLSFPKGESTLGVYVSDGGIIASLQYKVSVGDSGEFSCILIPPELDFNGNGYLDFGDSEILSSHVANWTVDLRGIDPDINGDGRVNSADIAALSVKMKP